jgi:hypothetical protein
VGKRTEYVDGMWMSTVEGEKQKEVFRQSSLLGGGGGGGGGQGGYIGNLNNSILSSKCQWDITGVRRLEISNIDWILSCSSPVEKL